MKEGLIKNDKSTADLTMEPLHYLNAMHGTGSYSEEQKTSRVLLFLVQTNFFRLNSRKNGKNLAGEFCSYIVFYSSLPKLRIG